MLSMINPDTLSKMEQNVRYSSINNGHITNKASQDQFYENQEHMDTVNPNHMSHQKPGTATMGQKTLNNFYQAQQMQDMSKRPGSASIPKPRVKNNFMRNSKK